MNSNVLLVHMMDQLLLQVETVAFMFLQTMALIGQTGFMQQDGYLPLLYIVEIFGR